jgi:hypothetical protein
MNGKPTLKEQGLLPGIRSAAELRLKFSQLSLQPSLLNTAILPPHLAHGWPLFVDNSPSCAKKILEFSESPQFSNERSV